MNAPSPSFSSVIPQWMSEAYGRPSADDAMRWLLATICQHLGAEACLVFRLNRTGTHGTAAWTHGPPAVQSLPRDLYPLAGSELERTLAAQTPLPFEPTLVAKDPWLGNLGITNGATVALQQGPIRFGSMGVYFLRQEANGTDALALLTEIRTVIWPLLCWQIMSAAADEMANAQRDASVVSAVHRANNILANIVLLTDLAMSEPCGKNDPAMRQLLQRIAAEGARCADVLREIDAGKA